MFFLECKIAMYRNRHLSFDLKSDDQDALRTVLEMVELLEEEGLVDMELTTK